MEEKLSVEVEKVVFQNEQNNWAVLRVRSQDRDLVACGMISHVAVGETLDLFGAWEQHSKYGEQFHFAFAQHSPTFSPDALTKYLASGAFHGIGTVTAERIVKAFGEDTVKVLDETPQKILRIPKISRKPILNLIAQWQTNKQEREIIVALHSLGIPSHVASRIFKLYGERALAAVHEDPYALTQHVRGLGFMIADRIGLKIGIEPNSARRIRGACMYFLRAAEKRGHCFLTMQQLYAQIEENLKISGQQENFQSALQMAANAKELVIERGDTLYRQPVYVAETNAAHVIKRLLQPINASSNTDFAAAPQHLSTEQRQAAHNAFLHRISILTGAAGTGKTSTVEYALQLARQRSWQYSLCAPTGRAACRLTELTGQEAKTIHRLLEWQPQSETFARNVDNPLGSEFKLLVVDEVSMLDLRLAAALLVSLPVGMHLMLVGDVNQLPAVGAGNFLRDLLASKVPQIKLQRIFRQGQASQIIHNAHLLVSGSTQGYLQGRDFLFLASNDPADIISKTKAQLDLHPEAQILAPTYRGELGIDNLNKVIKAHLQKKLRLEEPSSSTAISVGDKVIQTVNNYELGVFNGDIGKVLDARKDVITVVFADNKQVTYSGREIDELRLAYAISVHKSQGSEFAVVIMPFVRQQTMMLNKNLCYTAITRAKQKFIAIGSTTVFKTSARRDYDYRRQTGLAARLR
ncbi:MAG: ATP-dependent RecD-like DNA helicase [Pseudomonadota bacterium]|nr:ATP-dependent RecD-like DNA helicase [Pseudomonadota bacterium]